MENPKLCQTCYNYTDQSPCALCSDTKRNDQLLCVVASPQDVLALEKTHEYDGRYHVLGGVLNPIEGITPDKLKVNELVTRVSQQGVQEVILAFNPNMEGDATCLYLTKTLKPEKIKITRLARGLPIGSDLEYADEVTLTDALKGRRET